MTEKSCMYLLRPTVRAKQLAGIIDGIDIADRKRVSQQLIRHATSIKNDLSKAPLEADVIRLFMESVELDHERLSSILDEYIEHQHFLCSLNFRNGETLNPSNLKRYGIFCLFHIGEHIGLSKEGKSPSPLYQFISIATDYDYKMISEHYAAYKKVDIVQEAANSIALRFIYDPNTHLPTISLSLNGQQY